MNIFLNIIKEEEMERVITLLSNTNDKEKCINIVEDILKVMINGLFLMK